MPDGAVSSLLATPAHGTAAVTDTPPTVGILHILEPKWLTLRASAADERKGRTARLALLSIIGVVFWSFIFAVLYRLLVYFRGVEEIGPLLAGKLLGLMLVGFFSILLL